MILQKKTAALLAAMMLTGSLTACVFKTDGDSVTEPTVSEVTTALLTDETTATAAETAQPAAETDPPVEADPAADAVSGKWEVYSLEDRLVSAGQYGSEEYCRLFQMELTPSGEVLYYDRGSERCVSGTWSVPAEGSVHLHFEEDDMPFLYPLTLTVDGGTPDFDFTLADGTLSAETPYLGTMVIRKTGIFTERQYPDVAWLSGNWICDEEKSAAEDPSAPLSQLRWEFYTVEQAVCASISMNGGESYDFYFGQIQPDGSFILAVEMDDEKGYPFADSVISRDGDEAKWEINFNGYGTVYMKKAQ